jgi:hypothetical protein
LGLLSLLLSLLAAGAALVSAGVAVLALRAEIARSRFVLNVELLFKLDERFHSSGWRKKRVAAATALFAHLERPEEEEVIEVKKANVQEENADEVLDFFETMGLMVKRGALDTEIVWHTFLYWIDGYWNAAREYRARKQQGHPTAWQDFSQLRAQVLAIEKRKNPGYASAAPATFLREEMLLGLS